MPTYEFRCANGHVFDEFHKISDAPSTATCPTCGAQAERAISGGAGLVFKGSGFYLTDYGKNAHRSGSAPSKPSESATSGDSAKKSESGGSGGTSSSSNSSSSSGSSSGTSSGSTGGGSAKGDA